MSAIIKENFLVLVKEMFGEVSRSSMTFDTDLHALIDWSSLQAMIVLSEIDRAYGIVLNAEEMRTAKTVNSLYEMVMKKLS